MFSERPPIQTCCLMFYISFLFSWGVHQAYALTNSFSCLFFGMTVLSSANYYFAMCVLWKCSMTRSRRLAEYDITTDGEGSLCSICNIFRPLTKNIHHCRECNVCIEGFDHHCGVLGVCIGSHNITHFKCELHCNRWITQFNKIF